MAKRSQNTEYRKYLSERMRGDRNPTKRKDVRAKIVASWKNTDRIPYGNDGTKGKGQGKTEAEELAAEMLVPMGFISEHKVLTGIKKGQGAATWYSIDFAHLGRQIAVEIDGSSHINREEVDARKDRWLLSNGWAVFRIPAELIEEGLDWLLSELRKSRLSRRQVKRFMISKWERPIIISPVE
jgi:very-short-patch-repair endonuclease